MSLVQEKGCGMSKRIFETAQLGNLTVKNRLVRSATWEGIATPEGGITPIGYDIYRELVAGGVGTVITGFTSVSDTDQYMDGMMRLSNDALVPQYRKLVDIIHKQDVPVLAQLALGGYYPTPTAKPVEPDDMTSAQIEQVIQQFVDAARRAESAGYDGVQVHVAHFFFLSRFVSPAVNHRTDEWGGSTANRARIVCRIIEGIREVAPSLHVCAKVNCTDLVVGGIEKSEALELCRIYVQAGLESVEVSGNGTSVAGVRPGVGEAYFGKFGALAAHELPIPVILVGGMRSGETIQSVLEHTGIELVSLSRPLLREPDWPNKLKEDISLQSACISCNRCYNTPTHRCIFRLRG